MINLVVIRIGIPPSEYREYLQVQTPKRITIEIANMLIIKPLQCLMLRSTQKLAYPFQTS